ncbi:MAG: hypothetical protein HY688_04450 [Chloroflexi bacterium]|nr:hypothetical protein [Chloroflexota bacterium]
MAGAKKGPSGRLSRRDFLRLGWVGGLARGSEVLEQALGRGRRAPAPVRLGPLERLRAMPVGSVQAGPRGSRLYLVRLAEGLLALSARCPQDGHLVSWRPQEPSEDTLGPRGRFYCNADASIYDRRGLAVAGPSPRPLDAVPLMHRDGTLWADAAVAFQRAPDLVDTALFRLDGEV